MSISFCLPHPVAVSAFMNCRGLCVCVYWDVVDVCAVCEFWVYGKIQNLWVRCHGQCIVVLSEFSMRLFCFFPGKNFM